MNTHTEVTIPREELYQRIWERPLRDIAAELGSRRRNWLAEVKADALIWADGVDENEKAAAVADLLARNIKLRYGPSTVTTQTT